MRGTSATNYLVISTFDDPLLLLAGRYKLDPATMMSADDFKYQAQLLKQRFFSELILAAFPKAATNSDSLEISITKVAPRLVVNFNITIVICILYLVLGIAAGGGLYTSSPQTRPLGLSYDPNILSTSALAVQGDGCLKSLEGLDYSTMDQVTKTLQSSTVFLDHGELGIIRRRESSLIHSPPAKRRGRDIFGYFAQPDQTPKVKNNGEEWRLRRLRKRIGVFYGVILAAIVSALGTLYALSKTAGLY
jgi:hypothetical protein